MSHCLCWERDGATDPERRRLVLVKSPMVKVFTVLMVGTLGLVALFFLYPRTQPPSPADLPAPKASSQVETPQAQISQAHSGEPYTLTLSSGELTTLAGQYLAANPGVPFTQAQVSIDGESVVVTGVTRGLPLTLPVRVSALVGAKDGVPWAQVKDVSLGQVPVPGVLRDQILKAVNDYLDLSRYPIPVSIDSLELGAASVTISGQKK